ncbi:hypothetical protein VTK26DRAFT_5446 [Humicola hyalothermophila]
MGWPVGCTNGPRQQPRPEASGQAFIPHKFSIGRPLPTNPTVVPLASLPACEGFVPPDPRVCIQPHRAESCSGATLTLSDNSVFREQEGEGESLLGVEPKAMLCDCQRPCQGANSGGGLRTRSSVRTAGHAAGSRPAPQGRGRPKRNRERGLF